MVIKLSNRQLTPGHDVKWPCLGVHCSPFILCDVWWVRRMTIVSVDTRSVCVNTKWERGLVKKIVVERLCWNFTLSVAKICRGNKWTRKIGFLSSKKTLAWLWLTRDKLLNFVLKLITALSSATHPHHPSLPGQPGLWLSPGQAL